MPVTKLNVVQDPEKPVERNILAKAIVDIAGAARRLQVSGLNEDAITVLVSAKTNLGRGTVRDVLRSLSQLERDFCSR